MTVYPLVGISEPFSSISHFVGALVCMTHAVQLCGTAGQSRSEKLALAVFSAACIVLLIFSGLYHLLPAGPFRDMLQRLDHAAIFILIAGTFTPIHAILFKGFWRWMPLVVIWMVAVTGVILKAIFFSRIPDGAGISIYLGMGWLGAGTAGLAWSQRGFSFIIPLLNGSILYSVGTIFEFLHEPNLLPGIIGHHELFHLMVLAGMAYHWKFVFSLSAPQASENSLRNGEEIFSPAPNSGFR